MPNLALARRCGSAECIKTIHCSFNFTTNLSERFSTIEASDTIPRQGSMKINLEKLEMLSSLVIHHWEHFLSVRFCQSYVIVTRKGAQRAVFSVSVTHWHFSISESEQQLGSYKRWHYAFQTVCACLLSFSIYRYRYIFTQYSAGCQCLAYSGWILSWQDLVRSPPWSFIYVFAHICITTLKNDTPEFPNRLPQSQQNERWKQAAKESEIIMTFVGNIKRDESGLE